MTEILFPFLDLSWRLPVVQIIPGVIPLDLIKATLETVNEEEQPVSSAIGSPGFHSGELVFKATNSSI